MTESIQLPSEPEAALELLRARSQDADVVVFKKSPICPVSTRAEFEFRTWLKSVPKDAPLVVAEVDVIAERGLARGLTKALRVQHESPQALWFRGGDLEWSDSHGALTARRFAASLTPDAGK